jgi:hypothetical protein
MSMASKLLYGIAALGFAAGSAYAVTYPEAYGTTRSVVPSSPSEATGLVESPPRWEYPLEPSAQEEADRYFARYEIDDDERISWSEAQADPDLARVFELADENGDRQLTRTEFYTAVAIARRGNQLGYVNPGN